MEQIKVDQTSVDITPEVLAKAFWSMSDEEQAEFFHALGEEVQVSQKEGHFTLMQWVYMSEAIKKRGRLAEETFMDVSAHAFEFWPQKTML